MRLNYYSFPDDFNDKEVMLKICGKDDWTGEPARIVGGLSVTYVKDLIKRYGGTGWTEHIDRSGSLFEVTDIKLKGNNSKFKYNHHL